MRSLTIILLIGLIVIMASIIVSAQEIYKVKPGDTLLELYDKNWWIVARANNIKDEKRLPVGKILKKPPGLENLISYVREISQKTDILPEILLAILEIETNWGINLGTGNYLEDMNPCEYNWFKKVALNLNENYKDLSVSKKPNYGWGGAMGPMQFLPSEWLKYQEEVSELTANPNPSPWSLKDSFAAAALKLNDHIEEQKEIIKMLKNDLTIDYPENLYKIAAGKYFAGQNWPKHKNYGEKVMKKAEEIKKFLK